MPKKLKWHDSIKMKEQRINIAQGWSPNWVQSGKVWIFYENGSPGNLGQNPD